MSQSDQEDGTNRTNLPNDMLSLMRNKELQNILNSNWSDFFLLILNRRVAKF